MHFVSAARKSINCSNIFEFATLSSSTRNSMLFYVRNIIEIKYRKRSVT
jgi:hypothetical protein